MCFKTAILTCNFNAFLIINRILKGFFFTYKNAAPKTPAESPNVDLKNFVSKRRLNTSYCNCKTFYIIAQNKRNTH